MLKHTCLTALDSTHCSPGPFRSTVGYDDSRLPLLRYLLTGLDQPLYFRRSLVVEGSCFVEFSACTNSPFACIDRSLILHASSNSNSPLPSYSYITQYASCLLSNGIDRSYHLLLRRAAITCLSEIRHLEFIKSKFTEDEVSDRRLKAHESESDLSDDQFNVATAVLLKLSPSLSFYLSVYLSLTRHGTHTGLLSESSHAHSTVHQMIDWSLALVPIHMTTL